MELTSYREGIAQTGQEPVVTQVVQVLESKRDEAVQSRSEVEARWLRDLEQYEGNTIDRLVKGDTDFKTASKKAPPVIHLTRTRTLSIAARIINMLVPSNEHSWNMEATPDPVFQQQLGDNQPVTNPMTGQIAQVPMSPEEIAAQQPQGPPMGPQPVPQGQSVGAMAVPQQMPPEQHQMPDGSMMPGAQHQPMDPQQDMQDQGMAPETSPQAMQGQAMRPVTRADLAMMEVEEAEERSNKMREVMRDQLGECRFNAEQRRMIIDGCKIGTGVLEGPVVGGSYRKLRQKLGDQWLTQMTEESMPEYKSVDPWNFYPMPCEHITRCEGVFIDKPMTRRELQELKLLPNFNLEAIDEILKEKPEHGEAYLNSMTARASVTGEILPLDKRYSVWKFTGSLTREEMEQVGIDLDEQLDVIDPIIEAWFCNTRLIKIKRHPLEGAYRLPYYVWNYEENETSLFGYGVPYFMRDSDRVIQSTWHLILHNAAQSAGSQIVRKKGAVESADETEEITGGTKQWYFTDPELTVNDVFGLFNIPSNIDALTEVHERARQNADEELAFPLLAQGEPTEAVPTASGVAMLMNASNVVQRRIAQSFDDEVIEPAITALYDYNMTYHQDDEIKGDMTIKPLGASKLVVKDMQAQHLLLIADITNSERFAPWMKDNKLLQAILRAAEVDSDDYMYTEEEMSEKSQPSEMDTLQLELVKAEIGEKQATAASKMASPDGGLTENDMAEIQLSYDKLETELRIAQMKMQQAAMEIAKTETITMAELEAKFQMSERAKETTIMIEQIRDRREQLIEGYMARLKTEEHAMKKANMQRGFDTF